MTVFNFPDTAGKPTDGTFTWTAPNGLLYSWDGDAWRTLGGGGDGNASITITDDLSTIPAPDAGDLAWHTIEARMYIYYQDDDSQQWVDASPAGDSDSYWERNGTTLEPVTDGDDVDLGTGDLSAAAGTFSGDINCTGAFLGTKNIVLNRPGTDSPAGALVQYTYNNAIVYRIGNNGNVTLGDPTSPNIALNANGSSEFNAKMEVYRATTTANLPIVSFFSDNGGARSTIFNFKATGTAEKLGGGTWSAISDVRAKEDIKDYSAGLAEIQQLVPRSYRYFNTPQTYIGLIAQEAEGAMPELVSRDTGTLPDGTEVDDFRTLDQTPLTFALINAVKEMAARIEALEAEVQALKGGN